MNKPTCDAWMFQAERLFEGANLQIDQYKMADIYCTVHSILGVYLDMDARSTDYDYPLRACGCAREIFKMDNLKRIGAMAYINALERDHDGMTQLMGKQIKEELYKIFMTGVLPPTIEEFRREIENL